MILEIDYSKKALEKRVRYNEHFNLIALHPTTYEGKNGFVINSIVVYFGETDEAIDIGGNLVPKSIIACPISPPVASQGSLIGRFTKEEEDGTEKVMFEMTVYCNPNTHWICMGPPNVEGRAIEFITGCIAVINNEGTLLSLWLCPDKTPDLTLMKLY